VTPTAGHAGSAPGPASAPTHGCARCGTQIPIDVGLCENCNPLGLKDVAASQAHGTVFLAIVFGVAILAVLGRLALSGIGPFDGRIAAVVPSPPGLSVTLVVANHGTRAGSASCRLYDPDSPGIGPESISVESPRIEAGGSATFSALVTTMGTIVRPVGITCSGP
jgi:hypothetical protein